MSSLVNVFIGLGLTTPLRRAVVFGGAGYAYQHFIRPSASYIGDAERPFFLFADPEDPTATYVPWFAWPLGGAVLGGVFL